MALLQNITIYAQYPCRFTGGATGNEKSQIGQRLQTHLNKYMGDDDLGFDDDTAMPPGELHPYCWGLSITDFTPSTVTASCPQAVIPLAITCYSATVTIGWIATTNIESIGKIEFSAIAPRVAFSAIAPRIHFEGDD